MQLLTIDYRTFSHLLQYHAIGSSSPQTDRLKSVIENGSICNSTLLSTLWMNQLRNTKVCESGLEYELARGCVCKSLHGCNLEQQNDSFLSAFGVILVVLIFGLVYITYYDSVQVIRRGYDHARLERLEELQSKRNPTDFSILPTTKLKR